MKRARGYKIILCSLYPFLRERIQERVQTMKLTKILLTLLILTLPLIHGRVFQTLWFDFGFIVSGNFEFTKALYFNVFSCLIFLVFFIENILIWGNKLLLSLREKRVLIAIFITLWVSTYFSLSPFSSFIWDVEKWHTFLLISNLLWLYIVFRQIPYTQRAGIIYMFIASGLLACFLAIKELYYPSFDYWALWPRALWSFGHPNYLSGYLLLLLPFIFCSPSPFPKGRIQVWIKISILLLFLLTIILCKSLIALFLSLLYILYVSGLWNRYITKTYLFSIALWTSLIILTYIWFQHPEKLHSLISRWYLWETTLSIIFSDIKIIFLWAGLETLPYSFSSYKVPEMYIFENFGFTADRPHNFILNIFYHFWILGLSIFLYLVTLLYKSKRSYPSAYKSVSISVIILFLTYWIFHYFSISSYVVLIFTVSLFFHKEHIKNTSVKLFFTTLLCVSLLWAFMSFRLYVWEIYYAKWEYKNALEYISHPAYLLKFWETTKAKELEWLTSQQNFKTQIIVSGSKIEWCERLLLKYPSAENYFYCWELLEKEWEKILAKNYYNKGLQKLPDLWNDDSEYWDTYFVKRTITGNRFFSEKFWDINSVLEKVSK